MSNLISLIEPNCTPSILTTDLELVAMSVGQLQNPGSKDQIWYLVRHLAAKGGKQLEKKGRSVVGTSSHVSLTIPSQTSAFGT